MKRVGNVYRLGHIDEVIKDFPGGWTPRTTRMMDALKGLGYMEQSPWCESFLHKEGRRLKLSEEDIELYVKGIILNNYAYTINCPELDDFFENYKF